jgi:hypothetical protein
MVDKLKILNYNIIPLFKEIVQIYKHPIALMLSYYQN